MADDPDLPTPQHSQFEVGATTIVIKSDQEPAIIALKDAIKHE